MNDSILNGNPDYYCILIRNHCFIVYIYRERERETVLSILFRLCVIMDNNNLTHKKRRHDNFVSKYHSSQRLKDSVRVNERTWKQGGL